MNNEREYQNSFKDKRILSIYIIVIIAIFTGVTYALQSSSIAFNLTTAIVRIDEEAYGDTTFDSSNLDMIPILDSEVETRTDNVLKIDFTVGGHESNNASKPIIYDIALIDLSMDCELISEYFKWKLVKNGSELSSGTFSYTFDTIKEGRLVLTEIQQDLAAYSSNQTDYDNYSFYIWLSDTCQDDLETCKANNNIIPQTNLLNKYFSGKIEVELYTGSKKALVRVPSDELDSTTCIVNHTGANKYTYNEPNLDNGNLIPVYYDESKEVWRKADVTNYLKSWYDYDNKKWANAVLREPNTVIDLSNNANDGTIVGATWDKEAKTVTTDGVDDYINMGLANYDFGSDISLVIRVKFNTLRADAYDEFFGNWQNGGAGLIINTTDSKILFNNYIDGAYSIFTSTETINIDTWYTIVATYDGNNQTVYLDGTQLGSIPVSGNIGISTLPYYIGGNPSATGAVAAATATAVTVSDALIFDRALTASEVSSNYSEVPNPTNKNELLAHYDFRDNNEIEVGTVIGDTETSGTAAFYTWIPRYKYRVWNITRQGGDESTYAYPAFSNGIDIEWEKGTESTGNVTCTYDTAVTITETTLSDTCVYNGTDTITTTSGNTNYKDAWYTHPAFNFGGTPKTGFWVGKFESTGTTGEPTILPNLNVLSGLARDEQFTSSRVFQTYGLSNNVDAHMLTNLGWGAVAYLTHSIYGLCDTNGCRDVYTNNSSSYYTGRSGGAISGSEQLNLVNVYPGSTTDTTQYNATGYYDYKGYFIDYSGTVTNLKYETKVASTTGNITGIYDMVGGSRDVVMANMVDANNALFANNSGTNWNGSSTLDTKYYDAYSHIPSGSASAAHYSVNRARLGDAWGETIGSSNYTNQNTWRPGSNMTDVSSYGTGYTYPWIVRGGGYENATIGIFANGNGNGGAGTNNCYRSVIS